MLKKPLAFEWFLHDPVEQECIDLRADGLHKIASETIPCFRVNMEDAKTRIETESGSRKARFGFKKTIKIIEWRSADSLQVGENL